MKVRTLALASTVMAAALLAACSGGSSSPNAIITPPTSNPQGGNPGPDPNGYNADSIGLVNAIGAPMQGNVDQEQNPGNPTFNKCINLAAPATSSIYETFTAAANGNPASTDLKRYVGSTPSSCAAANLISETTRSWMPSTDGLAETVNVVISKYETPGASSPTAVRTETVNYGASNNFTPYGYPIFQPGTLRDETTTINVGGQAVSQTADEFVYGGALPGGATGNYFCGDQTGFNAVGDSTLDETFGWADQSEGTTGQRVIVSPTQVVMSSTRTGTVYTGPIDSMTIQTNTPNTVCPFTSGPMYQANVTGGYLRIPFTLPLAYTFTSGFLTKVAITNGTLDNGQVTVSIKSANPSGPGQKLLTGTITWAATNQTIGTFFESINGFGTLTVGANSYNIADWHVID